MAKLIGITGGIGSGKSVVAHICEVLGYAVYDCDSRAKRLMNQSEQIKHELCRIAGDECVDDNRCINRKHLAAQLFGNESVRQQVNVIVHRSVREDILHESEMLGDNKVLFVESAIMRVSGLDRLMSRIWLVEAPIDVRIQRVVQRNGLPHEQIRQRILSQAEEYTSLNCKHIDKIYNDGDHSLLLQLHDLLSLL